MTWFLVIRCSICIHIVSHSRSLMYIFTTICLLCLEFLAQPMDFWQVIKSIRCLLIYRLLVFCGLFSSSIIVLVLPMMTNRTILHKQNTKTQFFKEYFSCLRDYYWLK